MSAGSGAEARITRSIDGPLVGRDDLIAELVAAADAAAHGAGSIVVLSGEAGIGKTSVARVLARERRRELEVTWGSCLADQGAPPFWPWRSLLDIEAPASSGGDQSVGAPRLERLTQLRDQLVAVARREPRVHVIEDLQWADVASVLLLVEVGVSIGAVPLLVVATVRTGEPGSAQLDDAMEQLRRVAVMRQLHPLARPEIVALAAESGAVVDDELVERIVERTGGNPLFVSELLRSLPTEPGDRRRAVAQGVPSRVADLIQHRLTRLPVAVADVLTTAAAIGPEGSTATLAAAHGCSLEPLLDLLDQGRAAHLLDAAAPGTWRFHHQLIRDAVHTALSQGDRARLHARVLEALAADPGTPAASLAHHALAALPVFDADRAVALAARAGEAAFNDHAYEEAVVWFKRALAAAPASTAPRWRAELLVLSGEASRHSGEVPSARSAFRAAAELTDDPELLARAALGYADPGADLGIAYRTDDALTAALLTRALAAQPSPVSVVAVQLEARLAAELYFSDEPDRARSHATNAVRVAHRLGDPRAMAAATAVYHDAFVVGQAPLDSQLDESAQLLEWARGAESVAVLLAAHRARVMDLMAAGEMAEMDAEILAFRRLAEPLRTPGYLWWPALWTAMRALLEGRHEAAEREAVAAFHEGEASFPSLAFLNFSFFIFFLRREQGRLAEMEQATRQYLASHADVPALRVGLAFLLAELGRLDEARGGLAAFDERALAQLHDRNWPASWFQLARVAMLVGDRTMAATLLEPRHRPTERCVQVSLGTVCLGATDLAVAWLHHTLGDIDGADAHYRAAEQLNGRIGARDWLAHGRADHARLLADGVVVVADMAQAATFRRDGTVWQLEFAGRSARLADGRGMRDVAHLLSRPGQAVSVMELVDDPDGDRPGARGAPALDERARREIHERLLALDQDEADAEAAGDGERAAHVRDARQALAEAVARDFGLGGRSRVIGDPVERARKTVSTRVRRAIAGIERVHPELGRHLTRSIDTGTWCAYRPAEPVAWRT